MTYTLPVIQDRENNRQFSNLVLTYTNEILAASFILKYEGDPSYFENYISDIHTPFIGSVSKIEVQNDVDIFAKSTSCSEITISFCKNDGKGGVGATHLANENCRTASLKWNVSFNVCHEDKYIDAGDSGDAGSSGSTDSGSPALGGDPGPGNNTSPTPNPPCEGSGFSDGNDGCYDPNASEQVDTNIETLENLRTSFKTQIDDLLKTATDQPYEKAYIFKEAGRGSLTGESRVGTRFDPKVEIPISDDGKTIIIMHSHYDGLVPVYSFPDLINFLTMIIKRIDAGLDPNDCFSLLASRNQLLAIKINDRDTAIRLINKIFARGGEKKELRKYAEDVEDQFINENYIEVFKDYVDDAISIYQMEISTEKWTKK